MKSYYEDLDKRINEGDLDAIDEVLTLCEKKDEKALLKLAAAREARERKTSLIFGSRCGRTQFCMQQVEESKDLTPIVVDFDPREEKI